MQVRAVSDLGVVSDWTQPRSITLSRVSPPTIDGITITGPRRRMMDDDLIITANIAVTWSPPSINDAAGFTITGYDVYVETEESGLDTYASPSDRRNLHMFGVCWSQDTIIYQFTKSFSKKFLS